MSEQLASARKSVVVTGAGGFVGSHLIQSPAHDWVPWSIREQVSLPSGPCDCIVHCAGLAHQMQGAPESEYFEINRDKSIAMARLAKDAGVPHFIYLSTTKVLGEGKDGQVFSTDDPCHPMDPYGESKLAAEVELQKIANDKFAVSIIRPPLVFGPGVKGNFIRLIKLCDSTYPLPFAAADSLRSMVYVGNLAALIEHVIASREAGVFHAGESKPIPVRELVAELRKSLGRPIRLFSLPRPVVGLLRLVAEKQVSRLFDGFVVDNSATNQLLGFEPPFDFSDGIKHTVAWYRGQTAA